METTEDRDLREMEEAQENLNKELLNSANYQTWSLNMAANNSVGKIHSTR